MKIRNCDMQVFPTNSVKCTSPNSRIIFSSDGFSVGLVLGFFQVVIGVIEMQSQLVSTSKKNINGRSKFSIYAEFQGICRSSG